MTRRGWVFFFSSRRRHTRFDCDWSSDVCSSDLLETGEDVSRGVRVTGREGAVVAGVHGLEHREGLAATRLTDDDALGSHTEGIPDEVHDRDGDLAFDVRGARLEAYDVVLDESELGGVLDRDDALVLRDEAREDVEERRLS